MAHQADAVAAEDRQVDGCIRDPVELACIGVFKADAGATRLAGCNHVRRSVIAQVVGADLEQGRNRSPAAHADVREGTATYLIGHDIQRSTFVCTECIGAGTVGDHFGQAYGAQVDALNARAHGVWVALQQPAHVRRAEAP